MWLALLPALAPLLFRVGVKHKRDAVTVSPSSWVSASWEPERAEEFPDAEVPAPNLGFACAERFEATDPTLEAVFLA